MTATTWAVRLFSIVQKALAVFSLVIGFYVFLQLASNLNAIAFWFSERSIYFADGTATILMITVCGFVIWGVLCLGMYATGQLFGVIADIDISTRRLRSMRRRDSSSAPRANISSSLDDDDNRYKPGRMNIYQPYRPGMFERPNRSRREANIPVLPGRDVTLREIPLNEQRRYRTLPGRKLDGE